MMHKNHIPIILICVVLVLGLTVSAASAGSITEKIKEKIIDNLKVINITWYDFSDVVHNIVIQPDKSSREKLDEMTMSLGMTTKLRNFIEKTDAVDEEKKDEGIISNIISGIGSIFKPTPAPVVEDTYPEEEGEAAWSQYMANYIMNYKPTGEFGGAVN